MSIGYCKLLLEEVVLDENDFVTTSFKVSSGILPLLPTR